MVDTRTAFPPMMPSRPGGATCRGCTAKRPNSDQRACVRAPMSWSGVNRALKKNVVFTQHVVYLLGKSFCRFARVDDENGTTTNNAIL